MKASEILEAAATVLLIPGAWTQHTYARSAHVGIGYGVAPDNRNAVCWCALGAIRATKLPGQTKAREALAKSIGYSIPAWNDARGQTAEQVAAKMFEAAEELKNAGK